MKSRLAVSLFALAPLCVHAGTIERQLEVKISLSGDQSWRNELQFSNATTTQDYDFSTQLRSDGILYVDNLIGTDLDTRLEIKQQYYTRQGLLRLKRENGGKLPTTPEDINTITRRYQEQGLRCSDDFECQNETVERVAALGALKNNSAADLEAFLAPPGPGDDARWLYFFGYAGCPVRIHTRYALHIEGMRAYDKDRKKLVPYALDRNADSEGVERDRKTLCQKYVATIDTKTGTMFLENLYIPPARGLTVRSINSAQVRSEDDLPQPSDTLTWTTAKLRQAKDSGSDTVTMKMTWPLDGDSTVGGSFDGTLKQTLTWSFKPVASAPAPASR